MFVVVVFLATIMGPALIQSGFEVYNDEPPRVLDVFRQPPTTDNLHAFEKDLEGSSVVMDRLRPLMQYAQFTLLADGGEKAATGRDGWLFYRPSVRYMTERPTSEARVQGAAADPLPAIQSFHDQLKARGIALLIVIAPNKESIYPERLSARAEGSTVLICDRTRRVLKQLERSKIEVVNLFEEFRRNKRDRNGFGLPPLYLARDTHWSPEGAMLAAGAVAKRVLDRGWVSPGTIAYEIHPLPVRRPGDLIQMLQIPRLEREIEPETVTCMQVVQPGNEWPYADSPDSQVLVLGDSFLRIDERDGPGAAGFIAHLAHNLRQPLSSIVSDGGASTVVRQVLARRPQLLTGKTLVVWEFVERDIALGTEGWQLLPLTLSKASPR
jgi:hypothetical protein